MNIENLIGGLGVTVDQAGVPTYTYSSLHGDTVATAAAGASSPTIGTDFDEYGNPTDHQSRRYGWLGEKQRSGDDLGGTLLMGVRIYSPILGRFLQTDSIPGGSANAYDYANQDPVNQFDLGGRMACQSSDECSNAPAPASAPAPSHPSSGGCKASTNAGKAYCFFVGKGLKRSRRPQLLGISCKNRL